MKDFWKITGATIVGLFIFMFVRLFFFFSVLGSLLSSMDNSSPSTVLKAHSVYRLDFDGQIKERIGGDDDYYSALGQAMGKSEMSVYGLDDILENIRMAKVNDKIDGIYLHGGQLQAGFATCQEIRNALLDFKESGKFIIAYGDGFTQSTYYVASVADRICMEPTGSVDWRGLSATIQFNKRVLDKLGVNIQVFKVGTYKSAVEPYILTKMSDANREQMSVLLSDVWTDITAAVSESRSLSVDKLQLLADRNMGFESEQESLKEGLIDTLVYEQQVDSIIKLCCDNQKVNFVSYSQMNGVRDKASKTKNNIAVIYAEGEISDSGTSGIVSDKLTPVIGDIAKDDNVKAVVLRVNSPGGSASASEKIWYALTRIKEAGKPVVVSMGDYAASGGYYISCNADYIIAQPSTLTGSIGIFGLIPNFSSLLVDKVGFDFDGVKTNRNSDVEQQMTLGKMTYEQADQMQRNVERGYDLFTRRCADGRHTSQDEIKKIAEGRVWSGKRAIELGLVDSIGSINDAICKAAELAELGEKDYNIVAYPKPESTLTRLMKAFDAEALIDKYAEKTLGDTYTTAKALKQLNTKPSIEARMEHTIIIR